MKRNVEEQWKYFVKFLKHMNVKKIQPRTLKYKKKTAKYKNIL